MDQGPDEEAVGNLKVAKVDPVHSFPEPQSILTYSADKQYVEFPLARMASSCVLVPVQVLNGLYAVNDITRAHKMAVSTQPALPMLVTASPAVAFCMRKVTNNAHKQHQVPRVSAVQSWVESAANARQLVLAVSHQLIPFHASVTRDYIVECMAAFTRQLEDYEYDVYRVQVLEAATLEQFVACCEASSFFYLHSCEQFLWRTLIAPHCGPSIALAEVLTPRTAHPLDHCANKAAALTCVKDFFTFKLAGLKAKYKDELPMVTPQRGVTAGGPQHKGYISHATLQEYWALNKYIYSQL